MKLVLNGGGCDIQVESARRLLNSLIDHNKKILYIPFAWPDKTYNGCLEFMTGELSDIDKIGIDMVKTIEDLMSKNFNDYACLYIGGGNTYQLLHMLKTSGAFDKIKKYLLEDNGIVYGGSAGAIIFGNITIADNVTIGANATVNKSCNQNNVVLAGSPASIVKDNYPSWIEFNKVIK